MRIKDGFASRKKHKRILKLAKGYRMTRSKHFRSANEAVLHADQYAFAGRKKKKSDFRTLWITRISAALTLNNLKYSRFIKLLKDQHVELDRKIMAKLAIEQPQVFDNLVKQVTVDSVK